PAAGRRAAVREVAHRVDARGAALHEPGAARGGAATRVANLARSAGVPAAAAVLRVHVGVETGGAALGRSAGAGQRARARAANLVRRARGAARAAVARVDLGLDARGPAHRGSGGTAHGGVPDARIRPGVGVEAHHAAVVRARLCTKRSEANGEEEMCGN